MLNSIMPQVGKLRFKPTTRAGYLYHVRDAGNNYLGKIGLMADGTLQFCSARELLYHANELIQIGQFLFDLADKLTKTLHKEPADVHSEEG